MTRIINKNSSTLTPEQQKAIQNGLTNMGFTGEEVNVGERYEDENGDWWYPVTYESETEDGIEDEFLFNVNDAGKID